MSLQQPWAGTALGTFAARAFRREAAHFVLLLNFFKRYNPIFKMI